MRWLLLMVIGLSSWTWGQALVKGVSPVDMEKILKDVGASFSREDVYLFRIELNGFKPVWLELEGCEKERCSIVALSAGFGKRVPLERLNEWNRTRRFSRAYLDRKGNPWVEWELDLTGGVTEEVLRRFFRTFSQAVLPLFVEHIGSGP